MIATYDYCRRAEGETALQRLVSANLNPPRWIVDLPRVSFPVETVCKGRRWCWSPCRTGRRLEDKQDRDKQGKDVCALQGTSHARCNTRRGMSHAHGGGRDSAKAYERNARVCKPTTSLEDQNIHKLCSAATPLPGNHKKEMLSTDCETSCMNLHSTHTVGLFVRPSRRYVGDKDK